MNQYTPDNPPRRGTARRLWKELTAAGFDVAFLMYNANCWGLGKHTGDAWGSWAVDVYEHGRRVNYICGIDKQSNQAWISGGHVAAVKIPVSAFESGKISGNTSVTN